MRSAMSPQASLSGCELAHLQLARAWKASGDRGRAQAAYASFLTLWRDADPDIPVFTDAMAEYQSVR